MTDDGLAPERGSASHANWRSSMPLLWCVTRTESATREEYSADNVEPRPSGRGETPHSVRS